MKFYKLGFLLIAFPLNLLAQDFSTTVGVTEKLFREKKYKLCSRSAANFLRIMMNVKRKNQKTFEKPVSKLFTFGMLCNSHISDDEFKRFLNLHVEFLDKRSVPIEGAISSTMEILKDLDELKHFLATIRKASISFPKSKSLERYAVISHFYVGDMKSTAEFGKDFSLEKNLYTYVLRALSRTASFQEADEYFRKTVKFFSIPSNENSLNLYQLKVAWIDLLLKEGRFSELELLDASLAQSDLKFKQESFGRYSQMLSYFIITKKLAKFESLFLKSQSMPFKEHIILKLLEHRYFTLKKDTKNIDVVCTKLIAAYTLPTGMPSAFEFRELSQLPLCNLKTEMKTKLLSRLNILLNYPWLSHDIKVAGEFAAATAEGQSEKAKAILKNSAVGDPKENTSVNQLIDWMK